MMRSTTLHHTRVPSGRFRRARGFRLHTVTASKKDLVTLDDWQQQLQPGARTVWRAVPAETNRNRVRTLVADPSLLDQDQTGPLPASLQQLLSKWDELPSRYKLVVATSLAFVICNMDKVNISVAIIPMAREFGWGASTAGLIQSAFFTGYLIAQLPGGYLTSRLGGRTVLPAGVGLWSGATAAIPLMASSIPGLCLSRAAVGLGEAVAPSAATEMVSRVIDNSERARAISFIFSGLHVGSLLGLLAAPIIIEQFGWASVFYAFGGMGLLWVLMWEQLISSCAEKEPEVIQKLYGQSATGTRANTDAIPWRAILRSKPALALAFTHFSKNYCAYSMLAWLPTFYTDTLSLDLAHAAHLSLLPPAAAIAVSAVAGTGADYFVSQGVKVSYVRKGAQCIAFLVPAACLMAVALDQDSSFTVPLITAALSLTSFSLAGLYCNHADLAPRYAPLLLGCTNTVASLPGIFGVALTGVLLDKTDSWALSLFAPIILFFLLGSAVFTLYGSTEQQPWADGKGGNNQPFEFEHSWGLVAAWQAMQLHERVHGQKPSLRDRVSIIAKACKDAYAVRMKQQ